MTSPYSLIAPPEFRSPLRSVYAFRHTQRGSTHHSHDWEELVIVTSGTASHLSEDSWGNTYAATISRGCIFSIHPGTAHHFSRIQNLEVINILYHPLERWASASDLAQLARSTGFQAVFRLSLFFLRRYNLPHVFRVTPCQLESLHTVCAELVETHTSDSAIAPVIERTLLLRIICLISSFYEAQNQEDPTEAHTLTLHRLADTLGYMERHFNAPIQTTDLARRAHLAPSTFNRLFKQATSMSPAQFLIQRRLQHARQQLLQTRLSVVEIALASGFSDSNYFTRLFRQHFQLSPRAYRARNG